MDQIQDFPVNFTVSEAEPLSDHGTWYSFVADDVSMLAPVVEVEVQVTGGRCWSGSFYGGREGTTQVVAGPGAGNLLVIAGGVAYAIAVLDPEAYEVLSIRPVLDVHGFVPAGVVVLVGVVSLLAVGRDGRVCWRADGITSDGFDEVWCTADSVTVRGYDAPSGREVEVSMDLQTGRELDR